MASAQSVQRITPLDPRPTPYEKFKAALLVFRTLGPSSDEATILQQNLKFICERVPCLPARVLITPSTQRKGSSKVRWAVRHPVSQIINKGTLMSTYEELAQAQIPLDCIPRNMWPDAELAPSPGSEAPVCAASCLTTADGKVFGLYIQAHHKAVAQFGFARLLRHWASHSDVFTSTVLRLSLLHDRNDGLAAALVHPSTADKRLWRSLIWDSRIRLEDRLDGHPDFEYHSRARPELLNLACEVLVIPISKIEVFEQNIKPYLVTSSPTHSLAYFLIESAIDRCRIHRMPRYLRAAYRRFATPYWRPTRVNVQDLVSANPSQPQLSHAVATPTREPPEGVIWMQGLTTRPLPDGGVFKQEDVVRNLPDGVISKEAIVTRELPDGTVVSKREIVMTEFPNGEVSIRETVSGPLPYACRSCE